MRGLRHGADYILIFAFFLFLAKFLLTTEQYSCTAQVPPVCI